MRVKGPRRTPQRDGKFLAILRRTGNVCKAVAGSGYARRRVYEWREEDADFAEEWEAAVEEYATRLEEEADRRAVEGYVKQTYVDEDGTVQEVRGYSDTLLIFRLKALKPGMYRDPVKGEGVPPQVIHLMVQKALLYLSNEQADELITFMAAQLGAPASGRIAAPALLAAAQSGRSGGFNGS